MSIHGNVVDTTKLREANRVYYDAMTPGQEDYWRLMAAPRLRASTLLAALGEDPRGRLVDLGCGNGVLLEEISRHWPNLELAGVDFSERQIASNSALHPRIDWRVCDLENPGTIPRILHHRFDHLVASEVIEHLTDPLALLASARLLAAPRARLLLSTQSGPVRQTERQVGHVRHFEASDVSRLLETSGWQPLRVWNSGFPFHDLSKWWANRDPAKSMARFGERPYGPAEKAVCLLLRLAFRLNSRTRGAQLFAVAQVPDG